MKLRPKRLRARKIAEDGLKRFPNSANLKIRLAYSYLLESLLSDLSRTAARPSIAPSNSDARPRRPKTNPALRSTARRLMAHAYAWHARSSSARSTTRKLRSRCALRRQRTGRSSRSISLTLASSIRRWTGSHGRSPTTIGTISRRGPTPLGPITSRADTKKRCKCSRASRRPTPGRSGHLCRWAASMMRKPPPPNISRPDPVRSSRKPACPIREPMKQKYLDDLRKAGLPERAERASP